MVTKAEVAGVEVLDSPCTQTVNARVPHRIQHHVLSVNSASPA